jgi:hypothetical protein
MERPRPVPSPVGLVVKNGFFYVGGDARAVVANLDFHTIAKVFGRGREGRPVVATAGLCPAAGRSIEAVCNQIQKSPPDVLRENVCPTGRRIKGLPKLDLKTLRLLPRSVPCEIETFLNERIEGLRPPDRGQGRRSGESDGSRVRPPANRLRTFRGAIRVPIRSQTC